MSEWIPLNRQRHQNQRWQPRRDYLHSSGQSLVPVILSELGQLMSAYTLAFTGQENGYAAVAVLGLGQAEHFYIGPNGQWLADYVPARLRTHPFQLLQAGEGKHALCIDAAHIGDDKAFPVIFDDDGNMSDSIQENLTLLRYIEQQSEFTRRACEQLAAKELIEPWPLTLSNEKNHASADDSADSVSDSEKKTVQGLYRISESALNALSGEDMVMLRKSGALALAYAQLLSVPQIHQLAKRAQWQARLVAHLQQSRVVSSAQQNRDAVNELFSDTSEGSLNFDDL